MTALELLKGRRMKVMTDMLVEVELTIKEVESNFHSRPLEEASAKNDWWPKSEDSMDYTVYFTNGASKTFYSITEIKVL